MPPCSRIAVPSRSIVSATFACELVAREHVGVRVVGVAVERAEPAAETQTLV